MDRVAEHPPLSILSGQLRLGLMEEGKQENLFEEALAFAQGFLFYFFRRSFSFARGFLGLFVSGFTLTDSFKFWLSRKFVRQKGQLAFPFTHVTLVGISLSLLLVTTGLGRFLFDKTGPILSEFGAAILENETNLITEESDLLRMEAFAYEVQVRDDLYSIAEEFRRTPDSIASFNNLAEPYTVTPGQTLSIPPLEGFSYDVKSGDTVASLARKFTTSAQLIVEINYLFEPFTLTPGSVVLIPVERTFLAGDFGSPEGTCGPLALSWPTSAHNVIGSYTFSHRATDLAADYETLYAGADGVVTAVAEYAGTCRSFSKACNYGYGGLVFIDLGEGYQIRYGHISKPLVGLGQEVKRGDPVAVSGDSGVAFGPHLHFELLCSGNKINPLPYLPF